MFENVLAGARITGWAALATLMLALSVTPASRIATRLGARATALRRVTDARRTLGIASALLAVAHAGVALGGYLRGAWDVVLTWPYLRAGLVALAILVALLVTSFPPVVRALRVRLWKPLHRLAYGAALFTLVHLVLSPFASRTITLSLFAALFALGLARALPRSRPRRGERSPIVDEP